jgi:hypothetical protein
MRLAARGEGARGGDAGEHRGVGEVGHGRVLCGWAWEGRRGAWVGGVGKHRFQRGIALQ